MSVCRRVVRDTLEAHDEHDAFPPLRAPGCPLASLGRFGARPVTPFLDRV